MQGWPGLQNKIGKWINQWISMNRMPGGCCRLQGMQSRKLSHFLNLLWANFEGYLYCHPSPEKTVVVEMMSSARNAAEDDSLAYRSVNEEFIILCGDLVIGWEVVIALKQLTVNIWSQQRDRTEIITPRLNLILQRRCSVSPLLAQPPVSHCVMLRVSFVSAVRICISWFIYVFDCCVLVRYSSHRKTRYGEKTHRLMVFGCYVDLTSFVNSE